MDNQLSSVRNYGENSGEINMGCGCGNNVVKKADSLSIQSRINKLPMIVKLGIALTISYAVVKVYESD